jgi:hypothetical protein
MNIFFFLLKDSGSEIIGKNVGGKVGDGIEGSGIYIHTYRKIYLISSTHLSFGDS